MYNNLLNVSDMAMEAETIQLKTSLFVKNKQIFQYKRPRLCSQLYAFNLMLIY